MVPMSPLPLSLLPCALLLAGVSPARAGELTTYQAAVERIELSYLRLDQLEASDAFRRAAEAAEDAIPWLLVDIDDDPDAGRLQAVLAHGDTGVFATVAIDRDAPLSALAPALDQLHDAIVERADLDATSALSDDTDVAVELLRGASRALDRHSIVLAGDRLDAFNERIRGRLVGIGCQIGQDDGVLVLHQIFPDGPAERAGLQAGDELVRIDGVSTVGMTLDDAIERVRGDKGSPVDLVVQRPVSVDALAGAADPALEALSFRLLRDEVRIPNVEWSRTDTGAALIRIDHFSQQTALLMRRALTELLADPTTPGIVLDLRGNSGGSMLQAAKTVDLFVDDGLILRTGGRDFQRVRGLVREVHAFPPDDDLSLPDGARTLPLVVLLDRGSASASEIVAGALQLLGRGVLVGDGTHGKGTVQQPFVLRPASPDQGEVKLKLTIAEYHLAEDTPVVEGVGLTPDVVTESVRLARGRADLPLHVVQGDALGLIQVGPGWRADGGVDERGDALLALAERIVAQAGPAGGSRTVALPAAAQVVAQVRQEEQDRLQDAMAARGLDWSADDLCDAPCGAPDAVVTVQVSEPPVAGDRVTVTVSVHNQGPAPLYRGLVRLSTGYSRLPWSDLVVPVGFVPPGETAVGTAQVELPGSSADRRDRVAVDLESDQRPSVALPSVDLDIVGRPPPALRATVRRLPPGPGHDSGASSPQTLPVEVAVHNDSREDLTGVQVSFEAPADPALEVLDREALLLALGAGDTEAAVIELAWTGDGPPPASLQLELAIAAEVHGRVLEGEVDVPVDGVATLSPPRVRADVPLTAPRGQLPVVVEARDDGAVDHLTVWWRGDKLAWRSGDGDGLALDLQLDVDPGTHTLVVDAVDDSGHSTRQRWYVHGEDEADATAEP